MLAAASWGRRSAMRSILFDRTRLTMWGAIGRRRGAGTGRFDDLVRAYIVANLHGLRRSPRQSRPSKSRPSTARRSVMRDKLGRDLR
jgi:hypothetical protein